MKDLFMCLLLNLKVHGDITEANMYKGGEFSQMEISTPSGDYKISITKQEKENRNA